MAQIVEYNGFHVPLDSPLAARLRKQDEGFAEAERDGTLPVIGGDADSPAAPEELSEKSLLKLNRDALVELAASKSVSHADDATKKEIAAAILNAAEGAKLE